MTPKGETELLVKVSPLTRRIAHRTPFKNLIILCPWKVLSLSILK